MRKFLVALPAVALLALGCTTTAPLGTPTAAPPTPAPATPTAVPATPTLPPATPPPTPAAATPTPTQATPTAEPTAGGASVSIREFAFEPPTLQISTGTQVTWTNTGVAPHTVTFEEGESSGTLDSGGTFERTFDSAGTFSYICAIHPTMTGTVTVSD